MTVQLHGASAVVHDHVAGIVGDFDVVLRMIEDAASTEVVTAVVRSNARNLATLAQWLIAPRQRDRVTSWTLRWPGPSRIGLALPRLGLIAPRVLHAAQLARRGGLTVRTRGLPVCILGPHARHSEPSPVTAFDGRCERCSARERCGGVPQEYLDAYAADLELRALS